MKTKALLLICFFLGTGLTQLAAQDFPMPKNGQTGSAVWYYTLDWTSQVPIVCDGQQVDLLEATNFTCLTIDHYKNQQIVWEIVPGVNHVIYKSTQTSEEFVSQGMWQKYVVEKNLFYLHINFKGNMGHQYSVDYVVNGLTGEIVDFHSNCH